MTYYPDSDQKWETLSARQAGFDPGRLADAIAFAEAHESPWPRDLAKAGDVPGLSQFEKPPWNEALGPFKPRGGTNGLLLKGGRIVGSLESARHGSDRCIADLELARLPQFLR